MDGNILDKELIYKIAIEMSDKTTTSGFTDFSKLITMCNDISPHLSEYFAQLAIIQAVRIDNPSMSELYARYLFNLIILDEYFRHKYEDKFKVNLEPSLN